MTDSETLIVQPVSTTHIVYAIMRFLRIVQRRKMVLIMALVVTCVLGGLYFATAERVYQAKGQLLVLNNQADVWNESIAKDGHRQGMLPTYERLFSSARVLNQAIDRLDSLPREARVDLLDHPREKWLDELRERLRATAVRSTNIIEISYLSKKPRTAETVVNSVVGSYMDFIEESHKSVASEIGTLLAVHMDQVSEDLRHKTDQLVEAKRAVKDLGVSKEDVVHPAVHRVNELHSELVEVQQSRIEMQSSLAALRNAVQRGGNLQQHLLSLQPTIGKEVVLGALGLSTKDGEVVTHLERMLFEEQATLAKLSSFYLENHPEVIRLSSRVGQIREQIAGYATRQSQIASEAYNQNLGQMLLSLVNEDLQQTMLHEQALMEEYALAEHEAMMLASQREQIRILEKEEQRLRDLDGRLQDRLDDIVLKTNQSDVVVKITSEAKAENKPVSPRLLWILFMSLASGMLGGSGIIYVMDVLDDRFRAPEELREQLGAPVLAIIRRLPELRGKGRDGLHVHVSPDGMESEAFRTLRTTLAFSGDDLDCLAMSSSEPSDGKTTVLANLGVATAQTGNRTLMIDADMRRPGLSKQFDVRAKKGLGNLLSDTEEVGGLAEQIVLPTGVPNLWMLPAGMRPVDPTGSLSSSRFAELLAWAQDTYDHVLIDTPPILAASDATIIGRLVDGLALVVQPDKNNRRAVHRAAEEIHEAKLNFLGIVANNVSQDSGGHGYGYGYGYGHDERDDFDETHEVTTVLMPQQPTLPAADMADSVISEEPIVSRVRVSAVVNKSKVAPNRANDQQQVKRPKIQPRRAA